MGDPDVAWGETTSGSSGGARPPPRARDGDRNFCADCPDGGRDRTEETLRGARSLSETVDFLTFRGRMPTLTPGPPARHCHFAQHWQRPVPAAGEIARNSNEPVTTAASNSPQRRRALMSERSRVLQTLRGWNRIPIRPHPVTVRAVPRLLRLPQGRPAIPLIHRPPVSSIELIQYSGEHKPIDSPLFAGTSPYPDDTERSATHQSDGPSVVLMTLSRCVGPAGP